MATATIPTHKTGLMATYIIKVVDDRGFSLVVIDIDFLAKSVPAHGGEMCKNGDDPEVNCWVVSINEGTSLLDPDGTDAHLPSRVCIRLHGPVWVESEQRWYLPRGEIVVPAFWVERRIRGIDEPIPMIGYPVPTLADLPPHLQHHYSVAGREQGAADRAEQRLEGTRGAARKDKKKGRNGGEKEGQAVKVKEEEEEEAGGVGEGGEKKDEVGRVGKGKDKAKGKVSRKQRDATPTTSAESCPVDCCLDGEDVVMD